MRLRGSKGQALTEFILVMPLFFVIVLAVVQFSQLYLAFQLVHYSAFSAARAAIVRPCMAFQPRPGNAGDDFSGAVYTAAVMPLVAISPGQAMTNVAIPNWMPEVPETDETTSLRLEASGYTPGGDADTLLNKQRYAYLMTGVRRVRWTGVGTDKWEACPSGSGPGIPCDEVPCGASCADGFQQAVPAPGCDLTLEVLYIYPMAVPVINRVIFGVFTNFSRFAEDVLGVSSPADPEDVMVYPITGVPTGVSNWNEIKQFLMRIQTHHFEYYAPGEQPRINQIARQFYDRHWYPLPVRGRVTLTVEGEGTGATLLQLFAGCGDADDDDD